MNFNPSMCQLYLSIIIHLTYHLQYPVYLISLIPIAYYLQYPLILYL